MLVLVIGVSVATFLGLHAMPGDPVEMAFADRGASDEVIQSLRSELGLNRSLPVQYMEWSTSAVQGDFGTSLLSGAEIGPELMRRLPRTLELAFASVVIGSFIGIPLGVIAARRRGGLADLFVTSGSVLGLSIPVFVLGTLLVLAFSVKLGWLPIGGYVDPGQGLWEHLQRLLLPAVTLGVGIAGILSRMTRSVMVEELNQDYVFTARTFGVSESAVTYRHALPNSIPPVFTVAGLALGELFGGTVIVEFIFVWPGMSSYLIQGATTRDYPIVLATVVVIGTSFIVLNILVDIVNASLDPRSRL